MADIEHTTNRLTVLAAEIRAAHEDACAAHPYSAERALDAGRALIEARSNPDISFGGWDRWVAEETGLSKTQAWTYMQLVKSIEEGRSSPNDIAEAGQRAILKLAAADRTRQRREASRGAMPLINGMEIRIGDCRDVFFDIDPNSVPLILTDPPYGDKAEPLYGWLAEFAERVLIPGGSLICYTGQSRLNRDIAVFDARKGLRYWWQMAMLHTQAQRLPGKFVLCEFKPVLWYVKGFRRGRTLVPDVLRPPNPEKDAHDWGQGEGGVHFLIEHLTDPGELIVDPFAGTAGWGHIAASMGRRWIGADVVEGGRAAVVA